MTLQNGITLKISGFWFYEAKNFSLKVKEIEAEIYYVTTEESGRSSFVYSGYRGSFHYGGQYNSAAQEFIGQVKCYPGNIVKYIWRVPMVVLFLPSNTVVGTSDLIQIMLKGI